MALKLQNHLMDRGRCHLEEGLHVGFSRRLPVQRRVGVDESEVLALLVGIFFVQGIAKGANS